MHIYIIPAWYPQDSKDVTACFFREQAHALASYGHEVTVIHITPVSCRMAFRQHWHSFREWQDGNVRTFFYQEVIPVPAKFQRLQDWYISSVYWKSICAQIKADQIAGREPPKLIHAHVSHSCAYYCLKAAKRQQLPIVVTEHYSGLLLGTVTEQDYERVRQTILQADAFFFVGSNFQKKICQRLGIDRKTFVIPNMVDTSQFKDVLHKNSSGCFTFLSACHLHPNKSLHLVIQAFHQAFSEGGPQVRLLIAGSGEDFMRLSMLVKELGEEDRIQFHGKYSREEVPSLFGQADAFVLTSKIETFGIVYLEAMMCGLPCIGTAGQGAEDIIDQTNGVKVEYGNIEQLVNAMQHLVGCPNQYDRTVIRNVCIRRFSQDAVLRQLDEQYQKLLKRDVPDGLQYEKA